MAKRRTNADRNYDRYERVSTRVRDTFRMHIRAKSTHATILSSLSDIYDTADCKRLTQSYRFGISVIVREWFGQINENHLEWCTGPAAGPTRRAHKDPWTPADSALCTAKEMHGGHFWAGSDRPYNEYKRM